MLSKYLSWVKYSIYFKSLYITNFMKKIPEHEIFTLRLDPVITHFKNILSFLVCAYIDVLYSLIIH